MYMYMVVIWRSTYNAGGGHDDITATSAVSIALNDVKLLTEMKGAVSWDIDDHSVSRGEGESGGLWKLKKGETDVDPAGDVNVESYSVLWNASELRSVMLQEDEDGKGESLASTLGSSGTWEHFIKI